MALFRKQVANVVEWEDIAMMCCFGSGLTKR